MSMSKKDYVLIASVLMSELHMSSPQSKPSVLILAQKLAIVFERENPAFKKETFLKACGVI